MGVSINDIFEALESNNQNTGGAYIDKKPNAYFIRGISLLTSLEDVKKRAITTVETNLVEGALIVIFVLVLFLGNLCAGLIVASAIPLSLLFAFGMMRVFGVSANLMSLGAIDFGLIVDGAVIIVEATMHHLGLRKNMNPLTQQQMDHEVYVSKA